MVRQEECLEYIRKNPGCTVAEMSKDLCPECKSWSWKSHKANIFTKCVQLEKYGMIERYDSKPNTKWRPI